MLRRLSGALLGASMLVCAHAAAAQTLKPAVTTTLPYPLVYVYRGAANLGGVIRFENMIGRKVYGVVDFNDYTNTPTNAVANLNWDLGSWGNFGGRKLAISIGLAFNGLSTADIAAGKGDAMFAQMGALLVKYGQPDADIRLGWEMSGGWYGWGQKGSVYAAAFTRAAAILKATPGSSFTVWFNPAAGLDPSSEMPANAAGVDGMAQDFYANSWNCGGCKQQEPDLFNGNWTGYWGGISFTNDPKRAWWGGRPAGSAVWEFGVGSRSDGHGACPGTGWADCDDGQFEGATLDALQAEAVKKVGFWDYNAGDYNSEMSWGERPNEALEMMKRVGRADLVHLLAGATVYTAADHPLPTLASGKAGFRVKLTSGDIYSLVWGNGTTADPIVATDLSAPPVLVAAGPGATATVTANADGSEQIAMTSASSGNVAFSLSSPRKLGFGNGVGGLLSGQSAWAGGAEYRSFTWGFTGMQTKYVYVFPN